MARAVGQRQAHRPEAATEAEGCRGIRVRLQAGGLERDFALFNLAIDSKLRACDLLALRVNDVDAGGCIRDRATVVQR
jgi:hypothetical protein